MTTRPPASRPARFQPCRCPLALLVLLFPVAVSGQPPAAASQSETATYRLHDGLTLFVDNPEGAGFAFTLAIRDLIAGLRSIGPNDHVAVAVGGPFANMGYEFSNYAWHYWRPGWRIIQHSDAPEPLKDHLREALLVCGDRLAFCRSWARVNGNSFAQIPPALRSCYEATGDPLQKELFEVYFDRFANGGWGDRAGIGPSGPVQEGFAYAYHYASYPLNTWRAVMADFHDERFQEAYDRMRIWFSYALADERIPAGAWSARTHYYPQWAIEREGPFAWKGLPGPPFTVSVNDADEWFAGRALLATKCALKLSVPNLIALHQCRVVNPSRASWCW